MSSIFKETFTKVNRETGAVLGTREVTFDMAALPIESLYYAASGRCFHDQILDSYSGAKSAEDFDAMISKKITRILAGEIPKSGGTRVVNRDPVAKEFKSLVNELVNAWLTEKKAKKLPKPSTELIATYRGMVEKSRGEELRAKAESIVETRRNNAVAVDDKIEALMMAALAQSDKETTENDEEEPTEE